MSEPQVYVAMQSSQEPLLVSPSQGNASPVDVTIVITYPGKPGTSVQVSRVQIDIPMGDDARGLSADKASIIPSIHIDPQWGWGTWGTTSSDTGFAFATQDNKPITFTNEHSLQFTLTNVTINKAVGVVPVTVRLQTVEQKQQKTTATGTTTICKMPFGFHLSEITTVPPNATIQPGDPMTLSWTGSSNASYSLYIGAEAPIPVQPAQSYSVPQPLLPAGHEVNVLLEAAVASASGTAKYTRTRTIVVQAAAPAIMCFEGHLVRDNGRVHLRFTWDTKNATHCEMTGKAGELKRKVPKDDPYIITPSGGHPLRYRYTLTAVNDAGTASKTLTLTGWEESRPSIPVGQFPAAVCVTPDGATLFVANSADNTVTAVDVTTRQPLGSPIPVGQGPHGMCVTPDGATLFVLPADGNTVTAVDVTTRQPLGSPIPVGQRAHAMCMTPDGAILFVVKNDQTVTAVDVTTRQPLGPPIHVGQSQAPRAVCVTPDGAILFVPDVTKRRVIAVDVTTRQPLEPPIPLGPGQYPFAVWVTPDGATLFVLTAADQDDDMSDLTVTAVDVTTRQPLEPQIRVGKDPITVWMTPDGAALCIVTPNNGTVIVTAVDVKTRQPLGSPIPVGVPPGAVCVTPDGSWLFITNGNEDSVTVLAPSTGALKPL
jgi:YVTN family beta-propeller protein